MLTQRRFLILTAVAIPSIVGAHLAWSQVAPDAANPTSDAEGTSSLLLPVSSLPVERVEETAEVFTRLGARVDKAIYPGMGHTILQDEIEQSNRILEQVL